MSETTAMAPTNTSTSNNISDRNDDNAFQESNISNTENTIHNTTSLPIAPPVNFWKVRMEQQQEALAQKKLAEQKRQTEERKLKLAAREKTKKEQQQEEHVDADDDNDGFVKVIGRSQKRNQSNNTLSNSTSSNSQGKKQSTKEKKKSSKSKSSSSKQKSSSSPNSNNNSSSSSSEEKENMKQSSSPVDDANTSKSTNENVNIPKVANRNSEIGSPVKIVQVQAHSENVDDKKPSRPRKNQQHNVDKKPESWPTLTPTPNTPVPSSEDTSKKLSGKMSWSKVIASAFSQSENIASTNQETAAVAAEPTETENSQPEIPIIVIEEAEPIPSKSVEVENFAEVKNNNDTVTVTATNTTTSSTSNIVVTTTTTSTKKKNNKKEKEVSKQSTTSSQEVKDIVKKQSAEEKAVVVVVEKKKEDPVVVTMKSVVREEKKQPVTEVKQKVEKNVVQDESKPTENKTNSSQDIEDIKTAESAPKPIRTTIAPASVFKNVDVTNRNNKPQPKRSCSKTPSEGHVGLGMSRSMSTENRIQEGRPSRVRSSSYASSAPDQHHNQDGSSSHHDRYQFVSRGGRGRGMRGQARGVYRHQPAYPRNFINNASHTRTYTQQTGLTYYPNVYMQPAETDIETILYCIRAQIEYYFSVENLCRDLYIRQHMRKEDGAVPVSLIIGFNRVKSLLNMAHPKMNTDDEAMKTDIEIVRATLMHSTSIEMKGDYVKLKQGWECWITPVSIAQRNTSQSLESGNASVKTIEVTQPSSTVTSTPSLDDLVRQPFRVGPFHSEGQGVKQQTTENNGSSYGMYTPDTSPQSSKVFEKQAISSITSTDYSIRNTNMKNEVNINNNSSSNSSSNGDHDRNNTSNINRKENTRKPVPPAIQTAHTLLSRHLLRAELLDVPTPPNSPVAPLKLSKCGSTSSTLTTSHHGPSQISHTTISQLDTQLMNELTDELSYRLSNGPMSSPRHHHNDPHSFTTMVDSGVSPSSFRLTSLPTSSSSSVAAFDGRFE